MRSVNIQFRSRSRMSMISSMLRGPSGSVSTAAKLKRGIAAMATAAASGKAIFPNVFM